MSESGDEKLQKAVEKAIAKIVSASKLKNTSDTSVTDIFAQFFSIGGETMLNRCKRCGGSNYHPFSQCPAARKRCTLCRQFGHFSIVCQNRLKKTESNSDTGSDSVITDQCGCCGFPRSPRKFHSCPARQHICGYCGVGGHFQRLCSKKTLLREKKSSTTLPKEQKSPQAVDKKLVKGETKDILLFGAGNELGLGVRRINLKQYPGPSALIIGAVPTNGVAFKQGLRPGQSILQINNVDVSGASQEQARQLLYEESPILVKVWTPYIPNSRDGVKLCSVSEAEEESEKLCENKGQDETGGLVDEAMDAVRDALRLVAPDVRMDAFRAVLDTLDRYLPAINVPKPESAKTPLEPIAVAPFQGIVNAANEPDLAAQENPAVIVPELAAENEEGAMAILPDTAAHVIPGKIMPEQAADDKECAMAILPNTVAHEIPAKIMPEQAADCEEGDMAILPNTVTHEIPAKITPEQLADCEKGDMAMLPDTAEHDIPAMIMPEQAAENEN